MKATPIALKDGTMTIVLEAETPQETALLTVFSAQTYFARQPAKVSYFGPTKIQLIPRGKR